MAIELAATCPAPTLEPEALSAAAELRQVVEIVYYGGCSHSEIAASLGQPLGTVTTRLRLGLIARCCLLQPVLEEQA